MATANPIRQPPATRRCCYCKRRKPFADFGANKAKKWGIQAYCKKCNSDRSGSAFKKWRKENPEEARMLARRYTYGITDEQFQAMIAAQGSSCAVCLGPITETCLHVDHCHSTGKVRGLLCKKCNFGLGHFKDDAERLRRAADYLEQDGIPGRLRRKSVAA